MLAVTDLPRSTPDDPDLADLIKRCARGDQSALRTLYESQGAWLLGIAHRRVGSRPVAEEVVLDAFGQVWRDAQSANLKELVFTPGFGFRYFSAIGPVRIDIGYNPQAAERLTVVTNKVCVRTDDPEVPCTPDTIEDDVDYTSNMLRNSSELVTLGNVRWGGDRSFFDRLQFHFSIGQAF